jgi:Tfp pilus assembly protein PilP
MMRRHFISVVMGGILVLLLAGGTGAPGLRAANLKTLPPAAPAGVSGGPLAKPIPAAALPPAPTYEYNAAGKPDPFQPFMETDPALKTKKEEDLSKKTSGKGGPISPLQQVDIEQLRLVGIAGDDHGRTAIVEDRTTKKFYPFFVGTYIGLNGGRVAAILPDRVVVEERVETQDNKRKKMQMRRIPMLLHQEP